MTYKTKILFFILASIISLNTLAQRTYFSGGYSYSVFICNDKTVLSWGDNYYGQLGRQGNNSTPGKVANVKNIVSIDAGLGGFCCALTAEGNILSWGHNFYGELGIGESCPGICQQTEADTVLGGETGTKYLENVAAIAVGQMHAYALLKTGEVVAWGNNEYGQLGNGTNLSQQAPVYVKNSNNTNLTNITMIAAGGNHGYALSADGYVYAWGDNQANQLGCGDFDSHNIPQPVVDNKGIKISNIERIDGGMYFGLMLTSNKMVYGVGAFKGTHLDKSGIHYKTTTYAQYISGGETPSYYLENVENISAGFSHAMAIVNENNAKYVVSWGDNLFNDLFQSSGGQLGNGNFTIKQSFTPVYMKTSAMTKINNAVKISAGCGISFIETFDENNRQNKVLVCGSNTENQLGFGDNADRYYPTELKDICVPYCGAYALGKDKTLCTPIYYEIQTPFSNSSFSINWFKNNKLIDTTDSYTITSTGTYRLHVSDKTGDCPDINSTITITEQPIDFIPLPSSFCNSEITFKVIGDGIFNWYNAYNGYKISSGKTISTSKYFCEEIQTDSIYQIWIEHENHCQPIALQSLKKCNCDISTPPEIDTAVCYNKENIITNGDSIVWYSDELLQNPISLNSLIIEPDYIDDYQYFITQIKDNCESKSSLAKISLINCAPWYNVSGTVIDELGKSIENATIYLYCDDQEEAVDSCLTNKSGEFSLITHKCIGKLLAKSPNAQYSDTWAGNKTTKYTAYGFTIDADIKHVTIAYSTNKTDICSTNPATLWEYGEKAVICNLNGSVIDSFRIDNKEFAYLNKYHKPILVVIIRENGTKRNFILME